MKQVIFHRHRFKQGIALLIVTLFLLGEGLFVYNTRFAHADAATPTTTIDWTDAHQKIDGFGVASAWSADFLQSMPEPQRSNVLDLLFSQQNGAGFSILRNEIGSGGGIPTTTSTQTIEPTEGNFTWNVDAGQIWEMQQATQRGVSKLVSAVWSPPAWMKTNNDVTNGGHVRPDKYQAFADYLAAYVQGYQQHFGLKIYALSPANEPNTVGAYQTSEWTATEFETFIRDYLKPTFRKDAIDTKVIMPEEVTWTDDLAGPTLQDPAASAGVQIVAAHDYSFSAPTPFADAKAQGKQQWQSETSGGSTDPGDINDALKWAFEIHSHMTVAESNAWDWWIGTEPHSPETGDGQALIYLDTGNETYTPAKRLFSIGNYSRFIRPGYVRIGATANPALGVYTSAYKDPGSDKVIVVVINKNAAYQALNLNFNGISPTILSPYVTSKTESLERNSDVVIANGSASVEVPAQSITTFVGTTKQKTTKTFEDPLNDLSMASPATNPADWFPDSANLLSFNLDGSRLGRTANADTGLIYNIPNMQSARVQLYYSANAPDSNRVVFYASSDGMHYKEVKASQDTPLAVNYWFRVNYDVKWLPQNTAYLKIEVFPNTANISWTPELTHVSITVPTDTVVPTPPIPTVTPITTLVDPLNDFSLVYSHTNDWYFDSSHPTNCNNDNSRASRTDNADANFVYNIPNMKSATVTLCYWSQAPDSNNMILKTSSDGVTFTTVAATQDTPTAYNDWFLVNYTITNLPAGTNFLMIEIPPNTSAVTWTPQVSQVTIHLT